MEGDSNKQKNNLIKHHKNRSLYAVYFCLEFIIQRKVKNLFFCQLPPPLSQKNKGIKRLTFI